MSERLDRLLSHMKSHEDSSSSNTTFQTPLATDRTPLLSGSKLPSSSFSSIPLRNEKNDHHHHQEEDHQQQMVIQRKNRQQNYYTDSVKSILSSRSFDNFCNYESAIIDHDKYSNDGLDDTPGQTTWIVAAFLLMNASLGAGLLNYPVAYNRLGGIIPATVIQFFALILMATTMLTLVYCARLHNQNSYHGVMKTMCGKFIMQCSAASIAITCFGISVTFIIIVGDQFDRLFATYIGDDFCSYWFANRYFTMSTVAIFTMWPMCYFKRLDFLKHINLLGVIASFYVIFLYIYNYYQRKSTIAEQPIYKTWPDSTIEFIASLPVVFFAYQTHEIVIPVHVSMKDKSMNAFTKTTILSLIILFVLYCAAGTYGYLSYGQDVAADIMLMYDAHDPLVVGGIVALIIKMITTYPPVVFCGRDTILRLILHKNKIFKKINQNQDAKKQTKQTKSRISRESMNSSNESNNHDRRTTLHYSITTIWNIAVLILSLIIPNITIAIGFLGSLASANVFIFPGLALIGLARRFRAIRIKSQTTRREENLEENISVRNNTNIFHNFRLESAFVQTFLTIYGAFIVAMGVLMFIIILWQMTKDLNNPTLSHELCKTNITFF